MTADLTLALRNLLRNRRRSITTLLALVVGASAILLFGGYSKDITYGLQTDFVQRSGHLQIQRQGYFLRGSGNSAAYGIPRYEALIARLQRDPVLAPMLVVVTPKLQLGGIAGNFAAGVSRTVLAEGVEADAQTRLREWNDYGFPLVPRPLALQGTPPDGIVIGHGVARVLRLCDELRVPDCDDGRTAAEEAAAEGALDEGVASRAPSARVEGGALAVQAATLPASLPGTTTPAAPPASGHEPETTPAAARPPGATPEDIAALAAEVAPDAPLGGDPRRIEILAANTHGAPNVASFHVVAGEQQGVKELDDVYAAMHLPRAQRLVYGGEAPQVTAILVQLEHTAQLPQAMARVRAILAGFPGGERLEVLDYATLNPFYDQTNRMFAAIFGFVFVLIGAIVLFVVGNTMSMSVVERTVEIGTLRAIGLKRGGLQRLFLCEGLLLGLAGAALGILAAIAIGWAVNRSGLYWTPPARIDSVALTVRVWGEWRLMAATFVALVVVAALSAWFPARRAARLAIVDALRHA